MESIASWSLRILDIFVLRAETVDKFETVASVGSG